MAEGVMAKAFKFILFVSNFIIFILGVTLIGIGVWVATNLSKFLELLKLAEEKVPTISDLNVGSYVNAPYFIIAVAAIVTIISFVGCLGALKENKCLLGTFFILILVMFIMMVVGAVLLYTGHLMETVRVPLSDALDQYDDASDNQGDKSFKEAWNVVQEELQCCGVDNVTDWRTRAEVDHHFPEGFNKPEGCCAWKRTDGNWENIADDEDKVKVCREDTGTNIGKSEYAFEGCFTRLLDKIKDNKNTVMFAAIGVLVMMFINMIASVALCMNSG